ncbi:homeobox protein Hox-A13a [Conger conger]|uniref:homeobox protein Hox-A13a n=1 Tax=Conger conger TaxID=82655 RepID=UPI002A5B03F8|nr:homeobox protein Hox-A13a [Conger conger]
MTASVLVRPRWIEPAMFLSDSGSGDVTGGMDGFPGGNFAANQCRNLMSLPGSLPPSAAYASSEVPAHGRGEAVKQCSPCSAARAASSAALPYGYFGSGYYPCRMPYQSGVSAGTQPSPACMDTSAPGEEFPSRAKEFTFYQSYAAGPYQQVPSYRDLSAPPEPRHEPLLPADTYPPWALGGAWSGQVYCGKDPPPPGALWKSPLPDGSSRGPLRRGRKKRMPYSKAQLTELEREYAASKFITKDTRRRISGLTGLSERQVTIWFQNRRVKEKKVVTKPKSNS